MKLDWLTFSLPFNGNVQRTLPDHENFQMVKRVKHNGRYKAAWELGNGAIYSIPRDGEWGQKALIEMQGKHAQKNRDMGLTDDDTIAIARFAGGSITRMDCAFDTNDASARVSDVWKAWEGGKIKTRIKEATLTSKAGRKKEPANTVYLGSTESEQKIVVYDKAKQMNQLYEAWVRVELRLYGDSAFRASTDALTMGIDAVSRQKIRSMVKTKIKWFEDMIAGKDIELTPRIDTPSLLKWLDKQVIPALKYLPETQPELIPDVLVRLYSAAAILEGYRPEGNESKSERD